MRVTDKMVFDTAAAEALKSRERLHQATQEISSGRRLSSPGEDPAASGMVGSGRIHKARFEAIREGINRSNDEINASVSALEQMKQLSIRAKEIAQQLANATYNGTDRANAAQEVDGLYKETIGLLNTQVGKRYLFAGFKDDSPPFDSNGNYQGNAGIRQIEIAPGVYENVTFRADEQIKGTAGGVDVLQVLQDLSTALKTNNFDGITGSFGQLEKSVDQLGSATATLGASQTVLDAAAEANRALSDDQSRQLSSLSDIDVFEAASRMKLANTALEASLSAASQSFRMTLLDKLG